MLVDLWGEIEEIKKRKLLDLLPEECRTECTIAKLVINKLMSEGISGNPIGDRLAECPAEPQIKGSCSTQKIVCSHPESGSSDNFIGQVNSLYEYVRG